MTPDLLIGDSYLPLFQGIHTGRFLLIEGRRGTGKTRAILTYLVAQARRYPNSSWLLARSTRTRLSGSVLKSLYKQVLPLFGIPAPAAGPSVVDSIAVGSGSVLVPMGMDDLQRSQSAEFSGGYVAEAVEVDDEDAVTSLTGAMREASGVPYHQVIVDCNPGAPGHWLNQIAEPMDDSYRIIRSKADYLRTVRHNREPLGSRGKWKRIITHTADNPAYFDPKAWAWTPRGKEYIDGLGEMSGFLRQRWLDGLWVAESGGVYPEFNESVHCCAPFMVPKDWPVFVFYDPGYDHPCAVIWIAVSPTGKHYIIDEIYGGGITLASLAEQIKARNLAGGYNVHHYYGDPQKIDAETQEASGVSIRDQMRKLGLNFSLWPRTGRQIDDQVEAVRGKLLDRSLFIFQGLRWVTFEFQSWRYKRNAAGSQLSGDDKFEDKNNNALDCVRGAIAQGLHFAPTAVRLVGESPYRVRKL